MPGGQSQQAVACFKDSTVKGEVVATQGTKGVTLQAFFKDLPAGEHGFHIHRAGDLRGEGCAGACEHFHRGPPSRHGGAPFNNHCLPRHTGDLGNIVANKRYTFFLHKVSVADLLGRSVIVHADPDDLGFGDFPDSGTTGHSGARIGCAIFGRSATCAAPTRRKTRRAQRGGNSTYPSLQDPLAYVKKTLRTPGTLHRHILLHKAILSKPLSQQNAEAARFIIDKLQKSQKSRTITRKNH